MKRLTVLLLPLSVLLGSGEAFAQATGTVNVIGSVQKAAAVRWWSFTPLNAEVGTNTPGVQNGPLSLQIDVTDIAAGNNLANYGGGTAQLMIRSNTPYNLSAQVTASSGFGSAAAGDAELADVGYGLAGLSDSGPKVFGTPAASSTIVAGYDQDPSVAVKDVDEEPTFSRSLDDVTGGVQVLSGPRISNRGGVGSPNNGLLVDTMYAMGPQFYTPTSFDVTVTYTLATP